MMKKTDKMSPATSKSLPSVVTRPKYPCRTIFSVISQTIAATPPLLSLLKMAYRNPKTGLGPWRGRIAEKLPSEAYAIGGIACNSTPIALQWDTEPLNCCRARGPRDS